MQRQQTPSSDWRDGLLLPFFEPNKLRTTIQRGVKSNRRRSSGVNATHRMRGVPLEVGGKRDVRELVHHIFKVLIRTSPVEPSFVPKRNGMTILNGSRNDVKKPTCQAARLRLSKQSCARARHAARKCRQRRSESCFGEQDLLQDKASSISSRSKICSPMRRRLCQSRSKRLPLGEEAAVVRILQPILKYNADAAALLLLVTL
jgi:hypothetical protein